MIVMMTLRELASRVKRGPKDEMDEEYEGLCEQLRSRLKKLHDDLKLAAHRKDVFEVHKLNRIKEEIKSILGGKYRTFAPKEAGGGR